MKLKMLLKDLPEYTIKGPKDIDITGISSNSKCVAPGFLFISKMGSSGPGYNYIAESLAGGCLAIITDMYNPFLGKVTQVICKDPKAIEGKIAANFYQEPSRQLFTVGVTGTSGKTTCSFLVKHLLDSLNEPCGLIGSVEYIVGQTRYKSILTTPDSITNHRLMKEMVQQRCTSCVMEASSHALEQGRVNEVHFDVGIFTNLTLEHLDYHKTMENYAEAKQKLFSSIDDQLKKKHVPKVKAAIICKESPWHAYMTEHCKVPRITYGFSTDCDLYADQIAMTTQGSTFTVHYKEQTAVFQFHLLGRFNILNCLSAVALGLLMEVPLERIKEIMSLAKAPQGRLERVSNDLGLNIYVDFAHKDDALQNVLECLKDLGQGRIITVFGCGGNRDRNKRPKMAQVAEKLSDIVIVTSDNPREEDPKQIIEEIAKGFKVRERHLIEEDRRKAIALAIGQAKKEDIILVAGKGHETYQIFAHRTIEFDDRLVAQEICRLKN